MIRCAGSWRRGDRRAPNVGKSTLFNRLTGTRRAIVDAFAGQRRDRLYGVVEWGGKRFTVVDTAGLDVPLPRDAARTSPRDARYPSAGPDGDHRSRRLLFHG